MSKEPLLHKGAKLAKFANEAIGTATKVVDRSVKALCVADNTATYGRMATCIASDGVGAVATDVAQMLLTGAGSAFLAKQAAKLGDQTIKKGLGVIGGVASNANRRNNRSSGGGTDSPTKQSVAYAGNGGKGEDPKKDSGTTPPKTTTGYNGSGTGGNGTKGTGEIVSPSKAPSKVNYGDQYTKDGRKKVLRPNVEYTTPNGHTYCQMLKVVLFVLKGILIWEMVSEITMHKKWQDVKIGCLMTRVGT
ncbi:hypothetical protein [Cohnella panacarvi]|uniref:hypothetical protein n=1 Tax=Cohnella panacarvi TaxID=400776 RepID=UPI00047B15DD|nr:hypothetical protein [Cohnella panacarvi]